MALANARYNINRAWFSDMRVIDDLRNQIFMPIDNHDELGMALFSVEAKIQSVIFYPPLFAAAFGTPDSTRDRIAAALAQFVQSLISYRSKSDLANNPMTNDPPNPAAVFTAQEMQGLQIYTNHCVICHELRANTNVWQANNGLDVVPTDLGTQNPHSSALGRSVSSAPHRCGISQCLARTCTTGALQRCAKSSTITITVYRTVQIWTACFETQRGLPSSSTSPRTISWHWRHSLTR
jgi:cytochrome c peroxidase